MKPNQLGQYLLELTAILSVSIATAFGTVDLMKALHSYSTLQEAVQQTLRCMRTTDSKCVEISVGNQEAEYQVRVKTPSARWPIYGRLYSATASWLELPEYVFTEPYTEILDQVSFSIPGRRFALRTPMFQAATSIDYLVMQSKGVFAHTGDNKQSATTAVKFIYANDRTRGSKSSYSPYISLPVGKLQLGKVFTSKAFTIPTYPNSLDCFHSKYFNQALKKRSPVAAKFKTSCDAKRVNLVLHVRGTSPSSNRGESKLRIALIGIGSTKGKDLGGRVFGSGGDASLVPRGLVSGYWSSSHGYSEFKEHQDLYVKAGATYKVRLWLERADDSSNIWNGSDIRIFLPKIRPVSAIRSCVNKNAFSLETCKQFYDSEGSQLVPQTVKSNFHRTNTIIGSHTHDLQCRKYNFKDLDAAIAYVAQNNLDQNSNLAHAISLGCPECNVEKLPSLFECMDNQATYKAVEPTKCADNYGVAGDINSKLGQTQAALICPPEHPELTAAKNVYDIEHLNANYSLRLMNLGDYSVKRVKEHCHQEQFDLQKSDLPADLQRYERPIRWRNLKPSGVSIKFYTGDQTVTEFVKNNFNSFGCFPIKSQVYGRDCSQFGNNAGCKSLPEHLQENSLMHGEQELDCDYHRKIRKDPTIQKDHSSKYSGNTVYLDIHQPEYADYQNPQWSEKNPHTTKTCYNEQANYDHLADQPGRLLDGVYTEKELPTECLDGTWQCSLSYAGIRGDQKPKVELKSAVAKEVGLSFIKQILPWTSINCESDNCVSLETEELANGAVKATAMIRLPLRILLNKTIPLSYSFTVRKEQSLIFDST